MQIIEGTITLFLAVLAWFFIPGFPHENRFLTQKQTEVVLRRVEQDRGDSMPDPLTSAKVIEHLKDWTLWAYGQFPSCNYSNRVSESLKGVMFLCTIMPTCKKSLTYKRTGILLLFRCIVLLYLHHTQRHGLVDNQGPPPSVFVLFSKLASSWYRFQECSTLWSSGQYTSTT